MLRVPPTKVLANSSMAPSSLKPPPSKPSRKVVLAPGHSPLDWAALTSKPNHKLRGKDVPDNFIRVPPSLLKYHNGRKGRDAWTEYQGRVYNITPYLPFHPGGEAELMRAAGRDAAKLFMEVHPWVNWDGMLAECLIGILVAEGEEEEKPGTGGSRMEEMD
jgi:cytochrome b involved in lipid metabolism